MGDLGLSLLNELERLLRALGSQVGAAPLGTITLAVAVLLFLRITWPSWRLLRHCLFSDRPVTGYALALRELAVCFFYLLKTESLYRGARLRIEIELLCPKPQPAFPAPQSAEARRKAKDRFAQQSRKWRKDMRRTLSALVHMSRNGRPVIPIASWFRLTRAEPAINRYFDMLEADPSIVAHETDRFLSSVRIETGFVAPLHLMTGLLNRFDKDWEPVIEGYGRSVNMPRDALRRRGGATDLRALQAFLFDCWLLWGPSVPLCTCRQWRSAVALQFGYGDENNSLPLLGGDVLLQRFAAMLAAHEEPRPLALPAALTARIRRGSGIAERSVCHAQQGIRNGLVLDWEEIDPVGGKGDQLAGTYYSAYLWVMFVILKENGRPLFAGNVSQGLLPFFDHANIADGATYRLLKREFARKALGTVGTVLGGEPRLRLGYACGFDDSGCGSPLRFAQAAPRTRDLMAELLAGEFHRLAASGRLLLDADLGQDYAACRLPEVIDAYSRGLDRHRAADA